MDLRYPIGPFEWTGESSEEQRRERIDRIEAAPIRLMTAVQGLSEEQLDTPYRPGGWTVRQVVHHIADSHLNSYTRFRLALTEDVPAIKGYDQERWANLADAKSAPVLVSLVLLESLHRRWIHLLRSMTPEDLRARSCTRNLARCLWIATLRCTPGMANITPGTSRRCASVWGGDSYGWKPAADVAA